jgi:CelD/BcsL family acetyltransferase involved in cellulose biosynthesis
VNATTASQNVCIVECYSDRAGIAALSDEWRDLWTCSQSFQPFCRPEWIDAYLRAFEPKADLMILAAREEGRLVGLVPLLRDLGFYDGLPVRRIRAVANAHTAEFDILHSGTGDRVFRAVWDYLRSLPAWDCVQLPLLPKATVAEPFLRIVKEHGYDTVASNLDSLFTPLDNASQMPEPWLQGASSRMRRVVRRQLRKVESEFNGKLVLRRIDAGDPVQLQRFYDMEASGWKGRKRTAITNSPARLQFYTEIARSFSTRQSFSLHFLSVGEVTLAASFGLTLKNRFIGLKSGYSEEYSSYEPGHLLFAELLKDLYQRGVSEIDFGLNADYMRRWTSHTRVLTTCAIFNKTPYGRLLHLYKGKLRPALRSALDMIRSHGRTGE